MKRGALLLVGGGVTAGVAAWLAVRKSSATVEAIRAAVSGDARGIVKLRLTGYWPYQSGLSPGERRMEGGTTDRKGQPIHTLEQHLADPVRHPYVSAAGDYQVWPYGQRLIVDAWPTAVIRVVDTGGHFHGANKVYRVVGYEPIDIAVDSSETTVPKLATARIVAGDNFEGGKAVATAGLRGQTVVTGFVEGRTPHDREALARALTTELGAVGRDAQLAAAWTMRNRADQAGISLEQLLVPRGVYGSTSKSGGYASTRLGSTESAREIADEVLSAPTDHDPTAGAIDFWVPEQQARLHQLGDIYRAAVSIGDATRAQKYERYAGYRSEPETRILLAERGLRPLRLVDGIELLGRD